MRNRYGQGRMNDSPVRVLDTVAQDDEMYRDQLDDMVQRYGGESKEVKALCRPMQVKYLPMLRGTRAGD